MTVDWPNLLIGAGLGLAISQYFAWLSSRELWQIARAFAKLAEEQGLVAWQRDKKGRITLFRIVRGSMNVTLANLTAAGVGKVTPKPSDPAA